MRFEYVEFDNASLKLSMAAKVLCQHLEDKIDRLPKGRASSLAMTKLEECYMWIGKAIRGAQSDRTEK